MAYFSLIVPVYNRPDEVGELLESLTHQRCKDFEVIIVEDGSQQPCEDIVRAYTNRLIFITTASPIRDPDSRAIMVLNVRWVSILLCLIAIVSSPRVY